MGNNTSWTDVVTCSDAGAPEEDIWMHTNGSDCDFSPGLLWAMRLHQHVLFHSFNINITKCWITQISSHTREA